jgi:hypothetical protein
MPLKKNAAVIYWPKKNKHEHVRQNKQEHKPTKGMVGCLCLQA